MPVYLSQIRLWFFMFYSGLLSGSPLRASAEQALAFVGYFRSAASAEKYLQAVRWAYVFLDLSLTWDSPAVKQAIRGGKKLQSADRPRKRTWIRPPWVVRLCEWAWRAGDPLVCVAFSWASSFLLRVRSELISLSWEGPSRAELLFLEDGSPAVRLRLARRKNRPHGTTLIRGCSCRSLSAMCPVHTLTRWLNATGRSAPPRSGRVFTFSYDTFQRRLREGLPAACAVPAPEVVSYSSKDFRRGMAQWVLEQGGSLATALAAGQWSSAAYRSYVDTEGLDDLAVLQALADLSDCEDDASGPPRATRAKAPASADIRTFLPSAPAAPLPAPAAPPGRKRQLPVWMTDK
jgi:hypothetical protein